MRLFILCILFILFIIYWIFSINQAKIMEKEIEAFQLELSNELFRRQTVYSDMIKVIIGYNEYEKSTFKRILDSRVQVDETNSLSMTKDVDVLFESYPKIKANENYKKLIAEITLTENRIENKVKKYNKAIKEYEEYIELFPNSFLLFFTKKKKYITNKS